MRYTYSENTGPLFPWIRDEVECPELIKKGKRGMAARRVQEWLCLNGLSLVIDEDYGPVTETTVREFQRANNLVDDGEVGPITWAVLVADMLAVLKATSNNSEKLSFAVLERARAHLAVHPVETGGQNRGPWVRLYMKGHEGNAWPWCAGFVTFLMEQACELLDRRMPISGSFSCDSLAAQARAAGMFVEEGVPPEGLPPGTIFLNRRTSTDWTHTGFVHEAEETLFHTIEGNANDEGSREGYEVCARRRGYSGKDFIVFPTE